MCFKGGGDAQDLRKHLPVLNDGRLGKKIKDTIQPYDIDALVRAAEKGDLTPADPLLREASIGFVAKS